MFLLWFVFSACIVALSMFAWDWLVETLQRKNVPAGLTLSATRISPRKFAIVEKMNGKVVFQGTSDVSADGKTMTSVGSPAGVSEPTIEVYQKQ